MYYGLQTRVNRLELVAETFRAALNELATVAPDWLRAGALEWYERYGKRIEDTRLPREKAAREAYAQTVGEDGFRVLDALDAPEAPEERPDITEHRDTAPYLAAPLRTDGSAGDPPRKRTGAPRALQGEPRLATRGRGDRIAL